MGRADADGPHHRRVAQVALVSRDRELRREVPEDRVRDPEVPLGVLEVDRVDLVRHRGGADLAFHRPLPEVPEGDVPPHVAVKVDEDRVEPPQRVEELGDEVVALDLGHVGVPDQAQVLPDELPGDGPPVDVGVGAQVGVVVADGAGELPADPDLAELLALHSEPVDEVRDLLTHRRRRGWLPVGPAEHRDAGVAMRHRPHVPDQGVHPRKDHLVPGLAEHERVGEVVDVLAGAGEVQELGDGPQLLAVLDPLLQEVFDGLHVVLGHALDLLHALAVREAELPVDVVEVLDRCG
mmetsp:Transcript_7277/g.17738  ORF Transcript_7277/g.17738 Transcript_7277/m.17738 type:complete len:294 (+) Transcript_7277:491-1372(+)